MGALLFPGVDLVEESLMELSRTKILFILIKVESYREGGLWKMFGYEACGKSSS